MVKLRVVENSPSVFYISDVCQPEKKTNENTPCYCLSLNQNNKSVIRPVIWKDFHVTHEHVLNTKHTH